MFDHRHSAHSRPTGKLREASARRGTVQSRVPHAGRRRSDPETEGSARSADLQRFALAGLAACNSEHRVHVGLTVVPDRRAPETVAATDEVPVRVNWLQHELRQGPDVEVLPGGVLLVTDLAGDERWPDFGRMCAATVDVRSMLRVEVSLTTGDRACLAFFSAEPTAFDHADLLRLLRLARLAGPHVTNLLSDFRQPLLDAATGDFSRVAIAVGTVVARHGLSSRDAFGLLRRTADNLGRALLDVAIETTAAGQLPGTAPLRLRGTHRHLAARGPDERSAPGLLPDVGGPGMWRDA